MDKAMDKYQYMHEWVHGESYNEKDMPEANLCWEILKVWKDDKDVSEEYAEKAAEWLLQNGDESDLENIPAIIERFFPNFRHELEEAIAEREALRKSDETAYKHYVR